VHVNITVYSASIDTWIYLFQVIEESYPYAHVDVIGKRKIRVWPHPSEDVFSEKDQAFFAMLKNTDKIEGWQVFEK
jgi:hypothetical protein